MTRIHVCHRDALPRGKVHVVDLGREPTGLPRQALVLRDRGGRVRAYRNVCKHLPIPLDAGGREFLAGDGVHLLCRTHGAIYRPEDGYCLRGPCAGEFLEGLDIDEHDGEIYLLC